MQDIIDNLNGCAVIFESVDNPYRAAELCLGEYDPVPKNPYESVIVNKKELNPHPWPDGVFIIRFEFAGCKFTLKMNAAGDSIRARANKLRKQFTKSKDFRTKSAKECSRASKWKPSLARPKKYNKQVSQQFLNDNEKENWQAYRDLFE